METTDREDLKDKRDYRIWCLLIWCVTSFLVVSVVRGCDSNDYRECVKAPRCVELKGGTCVQPRRRFTPTECRAANWL